MPSVRTCTPKERLGNDMSSSSEEEPCSADTCNSALLGAHAFAARAGRELLATGETARKRTDETRDELTPQELQIASLARDGLSNSEIGARLFISPRTVEYHLHKVFTKLGIGTRGHLDRVLPGG